MKFVITLQWVALMLCSMGALSVEVDYRHPNLTIVANGESLDSVLKSVGEELQILVTTPTGLNPVMNCDIREQPLELAFKKLLGDMSYSLQWRDDGERLAGLTILSVTGRAVTVTGAGSRVTGDQTVRMPTGSRDTSNTELPATSRGDATVPPVVELGSTLSLQNEEARGVQDSELHEAEIEQQRQEEVIVQEARKEQEKLRNQAQMAEYFEAYGISPDR